jgi:Fumarase C-terminus
MPEEVAPREHRHFSPGFEIVGYQAYSDNTLYPKLGMEAIWRIEVEDFPAFIIIDDKGQ